MTIRMFQVFNLNLTVNYTIILVDKAWEAPKYPFDNMSDKYNMWKGGITLLNLQAASEFYNKQPSSLCNKFTYQILFIFIKKCKNNSGHKVTILCKRSQNGQRGITPLNIPKV